MTRPSPRAAALASALLAAFVLACLLDAGSPAARGADAPADAFSTARAWPALEVVAAEPHPLASARQVEVRAFLEGELERLGVAFERQPWSVERNDFTHEGVNLLARLPAREPGATRVLVVAHYDSRVGAPGAGDDGAAVAAMLECLRALALEAPRRNALEFLFTDGEELGLLGAFAYTSQPAALADVGCVLNFEGRGNAGPAILFETGRDDRAWIEAYAACATRPLGSSLGPAVYERMPNDTDFTLFRRAGLPGLNFAWIGGGSAYHRAADSVENLDPRALQHHGETMLALARHLGEADLAALGAERGNATFFTLPGNLFVHYAAGWDRAVLALAILTVLASLAGALRSGRVTLAALGLGLVAAPLAALLGAALVAAPTLGVRGAAGLLLTASAAHGNGASTTWLLVGMVASAFAVAALVARRLGPRTRAGLAAGALLVWLGLATWVTSELPGASHALTWPCVTAALCFSACGRLQGEGDAAQRGVMLVLVGTTAGFLALALPTLKLLHQVGSVRPEIGVAIASLALGLALPLALPLVAWLAPARGPRSNLATLAPALAALALGGVLEALGR